MAVVVVVHSVIEIFVRKIILRDATGFSSLFPPPYNCVRPKNVCVRVCVRLFVSERVCLSLSLSFSLLLPPPLSLSVCVCMCVSRVRPVPKLTHSFTHSPPAIYNRKPELTIPSLIRPIVRNIKFYCSRVRLS